MEESPKAISPEIKAKPVMFIPLMDLAVEEKGKIVETMGIVYPGHGSLTVEDIKSSLRAICLEFSNFNWNFHDKGKNYLKKFLSQEGLNLHTV